MPDFGDYDTPDEWYQAESILFDMMVGGDSAMGQDSYLQGLFDTAMFDPDATHEQREEAYDALIDYMWDTYGIDFEDVFDWEDYREWYDAS